MLFLTHGSCKCVTHHPVCSASRVVGGMVNICLFFPPLKDVSPGGGQGLQKTVSLPTAAEIQNPGRQELGPVPGKLLHAVSDSGADVGRERAKGLG